MCVLWKQLFRSRGGMLDPQDRIRNIPSRVLQRLAWSFSLWVFFYTMATLNKDRHAKQSPHNSDICNEWPVTMGIRPNKKHMWMGSLEIQRNVNHTVTTRTRVFTKSHDQCMHSFSRHVGTSWINEKPTYNK